MQLVQQCDYIYQNKFFKCTYVHLCWFHSKPVQHVQGLYNQNKFSKCTYVHLCLFHSKPVQHVQGFVDPIQYSTVGVCLSACWDFHPPGADPSEPGTPPEQTPWDQAPPWSRPSPQTRHPSEQTPHWDQALPPSEQEPPRTRQAPGTRHPLGPDTPGAGTPLSTDTHV